MPIQNHMGDYMFLLLPYFAEILANTDVPEKITELRFRAMCNLHARLAWYEKRGYVPEILCAIAQKKGAAIMQITTEADRKRLARPHCPHFNGREFVADPYSVPEEELICWSETSLLGPLNEYGFRRYVELFCQVFPEQSKKMSISQVVYGKR